jgi:cob(I)alamin adenosyltransferase
VLIKYLDRLSDMLFVFARVINAEAGTGDIVWQKLGEQ